MRTDTLPGLQVEAPEAMPPPPVTGGLIRLPPLCPIRQAQPLKGKLTSPAMERTKGAPVATLLRSTLGRNLHLLQPEDGAKHERVKSEFDCRAHPHLPDGQNWMKLNVWSREADQQV